MKAAYRTLLIMLLIAVLIVPATMLLQPASASSPDHPLDGAVSGRATTQDTTVGLPNSRVAIVNAASGQELYVGASDGMGFYQFPRVTNTWDSGSGQYVNSYKIHVTHSLMGDGYSAPFAVEERSTAPANVMIYTDIQIVTATPTATPAASPSPSPSPSASPSTSPPPVPPADHTGAVCGRITTGSSSTGVPNAYVAIVLASDPGQKLYAGTTDSNGFYQFAQVQDTWNQAAGTYEARYKLYARHSAFGEGYTNAFAVEAKSTASANICLGPSSTPTATPPADHTGAVSGRITAGDSSAGAPNTFVAIVLASDPGQKLYAGTTDSNGFYQFARVQDTWNQATGTYEARYKLYARNAQLGERYSNAFAVEARSVASVNVRIMPAPSPTPAATATPIPTAATTPTPMPWYQRPVNVTADSGRLNVTGNMVYAPEGTSLDSLARDGRIAMQVRPYENDTSSVMFLQITPVNASTATISDANLVSQKEASLNGRNVTVCASADLVGVPSNATLGINVTSPEYMDGRVSEALSQAGLSNGSKVLAVVEVIRDNLENGRDIRSGSLTITLPRPADFDPSGSYKVVRESDGQYSLLDARLISAPDAATLTFEVLSPGGFSTFTLIAVAGPALSTDTEAPAQAAVGTDSRSLLGVVLVDVLLAVMLVAFLGIMIYWQVFRGK